MIATRVENLGFPLWQNLGFPLGTKLGVFRRLSCDGGMSLGRDLEIANFVDVVGDDNDLRWGKVVRYLARRAWAPLPKSSRRWNLGLL
jgi:hypothetical protein